jgi:hypothetical protein
VVRLWGKTAVIPRIPIVIGIAGRMPPAPRRPPSPLNRGSAPGAGGRADGHASPEDRPPDT